MPRTVADSASSSQAVDRTGNEVPRAGVIGPLRTISTMTYRTTGRLTRKISRQLADRQQDRRDQRSEHQQARASGRHQPDDPAAMVGGDVTNADRQRHRLHDRAGDALEQPERDEQPDRRSERAGGRPDTEQHERGDEDLAPTEAVRDPSDHRHEHRQCQQVDGHRPRRRVVGGAELLADGGERDDDGGLVEEQQRQGGEAGEDPTSLDRLQRTPGRGARRPVPRHGEIVPPAPHR